MLSRNDIEQALADGHLKIFPFDSKKLTGIGYNLSTTDFAFSINQGILLTLHEKTTENGIMRYVIIPPNDTVLFFSQEYIEVDNTIAGTFHSKVSCVSQGLGHISTTLLSVPDVSPLIIFPIVFSVIIVLRDSSAWEIPLHFSSSFHAFV